MKSVTITNYNELLEFIKSDEVKSRLANEVVCKVLNVVSVADLTKPEIIEHTEYYINKYCKNYDGLRPIFIVQKNYKFNIKDLYLNNTK